MNDKDSLVEVCKAIAKRRAEIKDKVKEIAEKTHDVRQATKG